jgi:hypothetical protein
MTFDAEAAELEPHPMTKRKARRSCSSSCGSKWWSDAGPWRQAALSERMARKAAIQLKVHRQII